MDLPSNQGRNSEAAGATVRVVLAWPDEERNIGSVCRAMKTTGIHDLAIVPRVPDRGYDEQQVAVTAVHAADIYRSARFYETVEQAVNDCSLAVAYTRRQGKYRKHVSYAPEAIGSRISALSESTVALVFGNEEHGLTAEQMDACHIACRIPTAPEYPSLNLSHAVQIACYEVFRAAENTPHGGFTPITSETVDELAEEANAIVAEVGFAGEHDRDTSRLFVRDLLARAALNPREARRVFRLFRKIRYGIRSRT
ncbi:MAG: RNA methyltransferase [Spirochaetales bacterium]